MTASEIAKLLNGGFTMLQVREGKIDHLDYTIWQKTPEHHEWHRHDKINYPTKASCKRDFLALLKFPKIIDIYDCLHTIL